MNDAMNPPPFPEELQTALERFQRKWRWLNTLTLLGLLGLIPLFSYGLLSLSDRFWETPAWLRLLFAVPVPVGIVLSLAPWIRRWVLDRPGPDRVARLMGRLDPRVGDRLLGAVELAQGGGETWAGSPALRQAAILQVATQLSGVRAEERLDSSRTRKILIATAAICFAVMVYLFWLPDAALNSFQRWLNPGSQIERFTFVRLSGFPRELVVPHGEPFRVAGEVSHVKDEPVREVQAKLNGPEQAEIRVEDSRVEVEVEGLTQARELALSSGDAKVRISVNPLLRPELISMSVSVTWPPYLERAEDEIAMRRRRLEVPRGSEVRMKGKVSRELESASAGDLRAENLVGADFEMPGILVETNQTLLLQWVDQVGLMPRQPATVEVIAKTDLPPSVSMSGIGSTVAVLEDEFLELDVSARDDFGLKEVWTRFRQLKEEAPGPKQKKEVLPMSGISGMEAFEFSPERLGYGAGSVIELIAMALDAYPEREPSQSAGFRILVLSKEEHAKMLLSQMDRLLGELDESIRQEALSLEANQNTLERDPADLQNADTTEKLLDWALDEMARAEQLMETHRNMETLIGEATKNDQIKDQQIAEWAEIAERIKNEALPAMSDAAEAMKKAAEAQNGGADAQDPSSSGEAAESSERRKQLAKAVRKQEEALAAMKRGEEDLNESIENSLSESFINRFKILAEEQLEVRENLNRILPETIGLPLDNLPEALRLKITESAQQQADIFRESRYIYDDLEGFYRRTQKPELQQVTDEMTGERYTERLPELESLIRMNSLGRTSVEATEWNRLFLSWADKLSKDAGDGGGGEGGGGGGGDEEGESLETMIALIRAREQQEKLRRHTRELNESYPENLQIDRDARLLSDRQYELAQTLIPLENRVVKAETKQLVSLASGEMMNVGVLLRQSVTGQESLNIQTAVIERLAEALDQSMGGGEPPPEGEEPSPQQNSAAIVQAIMQMMQQAGAGGGPPGTAGGEGSTGFGDPGRGEISGASSSSSGGRSESGGRAAASDPGNWPGRYRGMMQSYFDAMEDAE